MDINNVRYYAEKDLMESGYYGSIASMISFFKSDKQKRDIFFGIEKPRFHEPKNSRDELNTSDQAQLNHQSHNEIQNVPCPLPITPINNTSSSHKSHDVSLTVPSPQPPVPTTTRILSKALTFQDYLLIQGPPGTGKTSRYLISIVKQHLSTQNTPVVILAFTNRAVEEIFHRLVENELDFIILGRNMINEKQHINNIIQTSRDELHPSDQAQSHHMSHNEIQNVPYPLPHTPINNAHCSHKSHYSKSLAPSPQSPTPQIFISTVANYQNEGNYLKKHIQTDLLIIDEASQLLEYQLIGIIADFKKFILIGDHYQLPAVSSQDIQNIPTDLKETIGLHSLGDSLFERLHKRCEERGWTEAFDLLPEHYRMHNDIAKLINPFYKNKLVATTERQFAQQTKKTQRNSAKLSDSAREKSISNTIDNYKLSDLIMIHRTIFLNTSETSNTRYNHEEADKVLQIISLIHDQQKETFTENTIGIICAWNLQVNLITSKIAHLEFSNKITVDTIERFQGSERDIIIFSTAISSKEQMKRLQKLTKDGKVDRKLNVAISRAREQFILLGNKEILCFSEHYKRVIDSIECSV
jgi:DNA replication ATP-dependent helicase Dna2